MNKPQRVHVYQNAVSDSSRWDGFKLRAGDIVVCTPPKTGTTWTQMLCALLVHQSAELPLPLTRLSRWLDRVSQPVEEVAADFEAQPWRRVIKTHTPLDGLPWHDEVSYVFCGRDPRDAFLSMGDHFKNLSDASVAEVIHRMGLTGTEFPFPTEPNTLFPIWLTTPLHPWMQDGMPFGSVFYYAQGFWTFRHLPNIFFLHYGDLSTRLDEEMRRLARFLDTPVDEAVWPSLVEAATFASMQQHGDETAPGAHLGEWRDNRGFFRMARRGQWREILSSENQALYERISSERLEPGLKLWLEGGRAAAGDPKEDSPPRH